MTSNFVKLCTAALAGSILGIAYERSPPSSEWPSLLERTVNAAGSIISREGKNLDIFEDRSSMSPKVIDVNYAKAGENFKHSNKFGLPSKDNIRLFNDFILSYDRRLRAPSWVIEHLTPEKVLAKNASRKKSRFYEDAEIHEYFRSKLPDFRDSGYDRGHMAAAANHKTSQDDQDQTFALSNVIPQTPELNQGMWERLEAYVRWKAEHLSKNLYVVSGPLYLPMRAKDGNLYVTYRVLGNNHVSVPTHFFKVILTETNDDRLELEAFIMPNDNRLNEKGLKLDDYRIDVERLDIIERASGVIFFDMLDRQKIEKPKQLPENYRDVPFNQRGKRPG